MKKQTIYELIKAHYQQNESKFKELSTEIARYFISNNSETSGYNLLSFIDNEARISYSEFPQDKMFEFIKVHKNFKNENIYMPISLEKDLTSIAKIISMQNKDLQKFLFYGDPGTGKTATAVSLTKNLKIPLYTVNLTDIIDSKLGETSKNINKLIEEIWELDSISETVVLLIDEIDRIALDRVNTTDHREMGRATTAFFKLLEINFPNIYIVATTNLYKNMDPALLRRFDWTVDFNQYNQTDLKSVFVNVILQINDFKTIMNKKFLEKFYSPNKYSSPANIKRIIKIIKATSENEFEFFSRLFEKLNGKKATLINLNEQGFTTREIAKIIPKSKSTIAKEINS